MAVDDRGGHGAVQQLPAHFSKVGHFFIQRYKNAHLLEFRQPGDVAAGYIRQCVGIGADQHFIVQFSPLVGNGIDLDAGILRFKRRDQHVHQRFVFGGLGAVMMPEVDGDCLALGKRSACGQEHRAGKHCSEDLFEGTHGSSSS